MNYEDIQFGDFSPELDFSPDITGETPQPTFNVETFKTPDSGIPENFWFQNSVGSTIISNNELPGVVDDKFGETIKLNENREVINKVYIMAMRGTDAFQLERMLKMSFSSEDFQRNPILRSSLLILPMVGPIFWACWPYRTEEDARQDLKRKNGLKPIFASECSKCGSCPFKNAISPKTMHCSKLGLPILNNDFNSTPPSKVVSHLRIAGYLKDDKKDYSWDDIRKVIIFPPGDNTIRTYKQNGLPKKDILPGAQYRKQVLALNRMHYAKQAQQEQYDRDHFILSICNPLIIKVQESFLKNRQNDNSINDYIQKIFIPENYRTECIQIIDSLKHDVLLWAGIRFYLPSYQKCDDVTQFFRRNNLRIPYAIQRNDCTYCIDNKSGFCKRLECKLIAYKVDIPQADRLHRIEIIGSDNRVNRPLIEHCKKLEQAEQHSGLKKLREILNSPQIVSVYNGAGIQDLNQLPGKDVRNESAQAWVERKLKENFSLLKIETAVKQAYGVKKGMAIIQDAIINIKAKPSDINDLCLTDFQIDASLKLQRLNKCITCLSATAVYCKKYNQLFSISFNEVPPEFNEIMNTFHDAPLIIDVDPVKQCDNLEVEMENPGESLSVDLKIEKPLNEQKLWQEAQSQKLEVETPEPVEFDI